MNDTIIDMLESSPIVAAIKNDEGLSECLKSECNLVFILYGTVCDIAEAVEKIKNDGRTAIVHADLIQGLSARNEAVDYIKHSTRADGIISTKSSLVRYAMDIGMIGILRTFIIDSIAMENIHRQIHSISPDMIEIMPGIMPEIIERIKRFTDTPVIAGGLIASKKNVMDAFNAGADAISTTKKELWFI